MYKPPLPSDRMRVLDDMSKPITPVVLRASEILDSRSQPTLQVDLQTADGHWFIAQVPSGASTGSREAAELRDKDPERYGGRGVLTAAANVNRAIRDAVVEREFRGLAELDATLLALDGTPDKSGLGANAILGVSMAAARAFAFAAGQPLWARLKVRDASCRLPVPHFNVVNGGAHADNQLDFQEFMIAPVGAPTYAEALRAGSEVYGRLRARIARAGYATGLGDEGGFAPDLARADEVLYLLVQAIEDAGYKAARDGIAIALDPAASEFSKSGRYTVAGEDWSSSDLIGFYDEILDRFPIVSIEDGLAEDDEAGWKQMTSEIGDRVQLVGDDVFVTNPSIIDHAIGEGIGNAALIKVNQVGTVTEALEAMDLCRRNGYAAMVSHRSGETMDTFIADLAVGSGCGQIKAGAPARGERVAKYNRILEISAEATYEGGNGLPYGLDVR